MGGGGLKLYHNSPIPTLAGSYLSNLGLRVYLESFKRSCGGWWCLSVNIVIGLAKDLDPGTRTQSQADQFLLLQPYHGTVQYVLLISSKI